MANWIEITVFSLPVRLITGPKLWISQPEALFTVMIFYDIKSMTWYPTISWTVSKTRTFLQTLERKITTEIQRNVKFFHLVNEKVICWTLTEKKKIEFRAKVGRACTGRRSRGQPSIFFVSKWSGIFQISPLIWIPRFENETPNKGIIKMTDEELEKSIDALFFSRLTRCMTTTLDWTQKLKKYRRVLGRIWVR